MSCKECGKPYGDAFGFPDLIIPAYAWRQISPTGDEGGLLCPNCICKRLYAAGIRCPAFFASGPLREAETPAWAVEERLLRLEREVSERRERAESL